MIRDRIRALSLVQGHQDIHVAGVVDADVIAAHQAGGQTCVQVFFFRGGQNWGNRAYFPSHDRQLSVEEVLTSFVGQFYDNRAETSPRVAEPSAGRAGSGRRGAVARRRQGRRWRCRSAATRSGWSTASLATAREALGRRLAESASQRQLLDGVAAAFGIDGPLNRIEVYDNSHIQGTNAVGAMIVAGPDGLVKNAYRKFTIRGTAAAPQPRERALPSPRRGRGVPSAASGDEAQARRIVGGDGRAATIMR